MNPCEEKIKKYIKDCHIKAIHLSFKTTCHSVEEAVRTVNTSAEDFVKNICLVDKEGNLKKTGFICRGVPSFGCLVTFLIDLKVMEKEVVCSGGGSEKSLIRISPQELRKANQGQVVRIRK